MKALVERAGGTLDRFHEDLDGVTCPYPVPFPVEREDEEEEEREGSGVVGTGPQAVDQFLYRVEVGTICATARMQEGMSGHGFWLCKVLAHRSETNKTKVCWFDTINRSDATVGSSFLLEKKQWTSGDTAVLAVNLELLQKGTADRKMGVLSMASKRAIRSGLHLYDTEKELRN